MPKLIFLSQKNYIFSTFLIFHFFQKLSVVIRGGVSKSLIFKILKMAKTGQLWSVFSQKRAVFSLIFSLWIIINTWIWEFSWDIFEGLKSTIFYDFLKILIFKKSKNWKMLILQSFLHITWNQSVRFRWKMTETSILTLKTVQQCYFFEISQTWPLS